MHATSDARQRLLRCRIRATVAARHEEVHAVARLIFGMITSLDGCDQLAISLERDDWAFVLAEVERWSTWERDDDPAARFERELRARVG